MAQLQREDASEAPAEMPPSTVCLAIVEESASVLDDDYLDRILTGACLVQRCEAVPGQMTRVGRVCLREDIEGLVTRATVGHWPFPPSRGRTDRCGHVFTDGAAGHWRDGLPTRGLLAVCSCTDVGCGATFGHMEAGRCLVIVETIACGVDAVVTGPLGVPATWDVTGDTTRQINELMHRYRDTIKALE